MKILIDTHVALWWVNEHEKLSRKARDILLDESNILYLSIVSCWEIAIKASLGKLTEFEGGVNSFLGLLKAMPVNLKPIEPRHVAAVESLPFFHRDPFDRMLIAAAMVDGMTILSADENIHKYDVLTLW